MKVTIKDIARETSLSPATISKFLNNRPVSRENRIIIEKAIQEMGYVPSSDARQLRSKKSMNIGILVPDLSTHFWTMAIESITDFFQHHGYSTFVCSYYNNMDTEKETVKKLIQQNIDGAILLPYTEHDTAFALFQEHDIPVVLFDQAVFSLDVDCVTSKNFEASFSIADYLLRRGHRNISVITGNPNTYTTKERLKGIDNALRQYGLSLEQIRVHIGEFTAESGRSLFQAMLDTQPTPEACIFTNYEMAIGAMMLAFSQNLQIPQTLSIICFDDDKIWEATSPPITSMRQNLSKIGEDAAKLLLRRIQNDFTGFPQLLTIETQFNERGSVMQK